MLPIRPWFISTGKAKKSAQKNAEPPAEISKGSDVRARSAAKGLSNSDVEAAMKGDGKIANTGNAWDPANHPPYQPTGVTTLPSELQNVPLMNQIRFAQMIGPYLQGQVGQAQQGYSDAASQFQQNFAKAGQGQPQSVQDQLAGPANQLVSATQGLGSAFSTSAQASLPYQLLMQMVDTLHQTQQQQIQEQIQHQISEAVNQALLSQANSQPKAQSGGSLAAALLGLTGGGDAGAKTPADTATAAKDDLKAQAKKKLGY